MTQEQITGAYLVIQKETVGKRIELWKEMTTIGRSRDCDIFLEDLAVSRLHATIKELPSGEFELSDNRSATGTHVNGQVVKKYVLHNGDMVQIGANAFRFVVS